MSLGEHKPRLKGDHPYRTTTRFQRDACGKLLRDDAGFLIPVIPPKDEKLTLRETTPEERAKGRERARQKREAEDKVIARQRKKIAKRQNIGDPDCRPSEGEDFPLLAVLRRDRAFGLITAVLAYRRLVAVCEAEPLKGQAYGDGNTMGLNIEYRSTLRDGIAEVDAAASAGFKGNTAPGGEIEYRSEIKLSDGAYDLPPRRKLAAVAKYDGDPVMGKTESLHFKINADTIAEYIDSKPRLERIRAALGPLLEPVEDAVLGGMTLQEVGEKEGFSGPQARSVGNALVMRGLTVIDGFLGARKMMAANDNYMIEKRKVA